MKRCFPFLLVILSSICSFAQLPPDFSHGERVHGKEPYAIEGEILLQLNRPGTVQRILEELRVVNSIPTEIEIVRELSNVAHIWHIRYNANRISDNEMLSAVNRNPHVRLAQFNHYVELRATVPNDPQYGQQWQYDNNGSNGGVADADIDAPEAWDITTGGITAQGDTIVVAIIDDGTNLDHPDLVGNLWKNYAEIPGNNIDDDGNGYIDDVDGWNAQSNNGNIGGGSHGTCVSGIVGAKGDNNIGVAGVNWNVKLMIIRGSSNTEATVISAYNYALNMRKRYNQTGGAEGAFLVATNSSFGVDNGNPANYPLWCAMYDSMGIAGILNAGATTNANSNVDVVGDIPTACSSDYLITVTNVGRNDMKVTSAGYGLSTIDIGSFGQDTWTLTQTGYGAFGGTSGATPHVTGTIALMYSAPCPDFIQFAKTNPAAAALQVKDWIMQSADTNASLAGITVSGKRLNTFNAVTEVMNNCGPCPLPGGVHASNFTLQTTDISWNAPTAATEYIVQYRPVGSSTWLEQIVSGSPVTLVGLSSCTHYQYRIRSICHTDSSSGYTNTFSFRTDGCCEPPLSSSVSGLTNHQVQISWPTITAATAYNFRYRTVGSATWINDNNLTTASITSNGLQTCARYEYQIATICTSGTTAYGTLYTFKTKGCGACEEQTYCSASGSSSYLYINRVQLGNIDNTSGDNGGYSAFIDGNYAWLKADSASDIILTPTFPVFAVSSGWMIWVDWNQNGIFEASELALNQQGSSTINGAITPPTSADTGITRMRIAAVALQTPQECGDIGFGEVEDYCVRIKPNSYAGIKQAATENTEIEVFPNPATNRVNIKLSGEKYTQIEILDISGKVLQTIALSNLTEQVHVSTEPFSGGVYFIRLSGKQASITKKLVIKK